MKGLLTPAILAVVALWIGVTVVLTCRQPPASTDLLTGQSFLFPKSFLPMGLGTLPTLPPPLRFDPDFFAFPPVNPPNPDSHSTPSERR
ncbi:MAG: hypothetical protein ACREDQ_05800, partial [Limisphaerales bacterium]